MGSGPTGGVLRGATPYSILTTASNPMTRFEVRYQRPYSNGWFSQFFSTREEAERMVAFYLSCGAPAHLK